MGDTAGMNARHLQQQLACDRSSSTAGAVRSAVLAWALSNSAVPPLVLQVTFTAMPVRNYLLTSTHGSLTADNNDCDAWW
jgi:hypothetical protein